MKYREVRQKRKQEAAVAGLDFGFPEFQLFLRQPVAC